MIKQILCIASLLSVSCVSTQEVPAAQIQPALVDCMVELDKIAKEIDKKVVISQPVTKYHENGGIIMYFDTLEDTTGVGLGPVPLPESDRVIKCSAKGTPAFISVKIFKKVTI